LIIGLDGATFDLIDPLIARGKLPNLQKLIADGVRGPLESTIPANSFPGWTSCTTGVNPGKHGIYYSLIRQENSYLLKLMSSSDVKARRLWQILNRYGKKTGVINVPGDYPPSEVDGFIVTGMLTPGLDSRLTYPESLKSELLEAIGDYIIDVPISDADKDEIIDRLHYALDRRIAAADYLMKRFDWDFFMVVLTELDRAQHLYWADMDVEHPLHTQEGGEKFGRAIESVYEHCDRGIGELMKNIDWQTRVLIVSDHGFAAHYKRFFINRWLLQKGLLALKDEFRSNGLTARLGRKVRSTFYVLRSTLEIEHRTSNVERRAPNVSKWQRKIENENSTLSRIDWSRTKIYFAQHGGLRVNLRGREPEGIVEPGAEYQSLIEQVRSELLKLRLPDSNQLIFDRVVSKEEVYWGPFLDSAPDLIPIGKERCQLSKDIDQKHLFIDIPRGGHDKYGILIASGPNIARGRKIEGAHLMDITPTALYMLDCPITEDMDGRVLEELFEEDFPSRRPLRREGLSQLQAGDTSAFTAEEERELEERLRGLGYIG